MYMTVWWYARRVKCHGAELCSRTGHAVLFVRTQDASVVAAASDAYPSSNFLVENLLQATIRRVNGRQSSALTSVSTVLALLSLLHLLSVASLHSILRRNC
jgi:hypothetical protein